MDTSIKRQVSPTMTELHSRTVFKINMKPFAAFFLQLIKFEYIQKFSISPLFCSIFYCLFMEETDFLIK